MNRQKEDSLEPKYKIILVGDSGVGKTSLFWRYLHKETFSEEPMTTIDFRYKTISLHDKDVKLCIWDTAGQEKFRSIVATYFKSCQGVVLVFDLTSPASWENIKEVWYQMAFRRAPKAKYLLLGNKKDLEGRVSPADVQTWCAERSIYFIQTCALTGESVEQAFFTLAALIDASQPHFVGSSFATNLVSTREGSDHSSAKAVLEGKRGTSFYLRRLREPPKGRKEKCCK